MIEKIEAMPAGTTASAPAPTLADARDVLSRCCARPPSPARSCTLFELGKFDAEPAWWE
jgi:hypothetical protein